MLSLCDPVILFLGFRLLDVHVEDGGCSGQAAILDWTSVTGVLQATILCILVQTKLVGIDVNKLISPWSCSLVRCGVHFVRVKYKAFHSHIFTLKLLRNRRGLMQALHASPSSLRRKSLKLDYRDTTVKDPVALLKI